MPDNKELISRDISIWNNIETIEPDEWDNKMLTDIATNPDCKEFISADEAMKQLRLK